MRKALPADISRLVTLMTEFYSEASYLLNQQRAAEAFAAILADDRLGGVWIIEVDSQAVGHVVMTFCFSMEYGGLVAFVDDLFVRAPFRRSGLGKAALEVVRAFCVERGVRAIQVETGPDNLAAQATYRRAGFTKTD